MDEFTRFLWNGVEIQMLLVGREDGERLGLVQLINPVLRDGVAQLSYFLSEAARRRAWPMEGVVTFIDYCFRTTNLRKIYLESLDHSLEEFESTVGRFLEQEGVLRQHEFYDGRFHDLHVLALWRETWAANRALIEAVSR
jgi:RimJ/RimL family protein N-acetyltransferase